MLILKRYFSFCTSHRLYNPKFSDEKNFLIYGKCAGIHGHGHNYKLEVAISGKVDPETSMVFNLDLLKDLVDKNIIEDVDHKHLNFDVSWLEGKIPTAEVFVDSIWERLNFAIKKYNTNDIKLYSITLWETEYDAVTKTRD
jgi:6-pyruvoyltetrahydropterin/6-carboxytetrahydropterin synthase